MNSSEAKSFLLGIRIKYDMIRDKVEEIEALRTVATNCTVSYDKENVQSSGDGDRMGKIVAKMVDIEREVMCEKIELAERVLICEKIINGIENEVMRNFLRMRFLEKKYLHEVAVELKVSMSTAKRMQKIAVREFCNEFNKKILGKS